MRNTPTLALFAAAVVLAQGAIGYHMLKGVWAIVVYPLVNFAFASIVLFVVRSRGRRSAGLRCRWGRQWASSRTPQPVHGGPRDLVVSQQSSQVSAPRGEGDPKNPK